MTNVDANPAIRWRSPENAILNANDVENEHEFLVPLPWSHLPPNNRHIYVKINHAENNISVRCVYRTRRTTRRAPSQGTSTPGLASRVYNRQ